jgi:quercetin dioxygenase-like cupin family protein
MKEKKIKPAEILDFCEIVQYQEGTIVSKGIIDDKNGRVSLFAFAKGEKLSPHKAPFDALVQVLEGEAEIVIDSKPFNVTAGKSIIMPANIMHAINAHQNFKMLLTLIKSPV